MVKYFCKFHELHKNFHHKNFLAIVQINITATLHDNNINQDRSQKFYTTEIWSYTVYTAPEWQLCLDGSYMHDTTRHKILTGK